MRVFITGDTHGNFSRFSSFCQEQKTTTEDVMIILGDAGLNYFGDERDYRLKSAVSSLPITFFCIHGNHEMRPATVSGYTERDFCGGTVWQEAAFPSILFAKDGEVFSFLNYRCIVIGGAYSVDKHIRLMRGYKWFSDEQPSDMIKGYTESQLRENTVDIILSHTCPLKYEPIEAFIDGIDSRNVDKSTEIWLDSIEESVHYGKWYCGHFHIKKRTGKIQFMYEDIETLHL